jgi:serine protease Do
MWKVEVNIMVNNDKRNVQRYSHLAAALVGAFLGVFLFTMFGACGNALRLNQNEAERMNQTGLLPQGTITGQGDDGEITTAAGSVIPSVVGITTVTVTRDMVSKNNMVQGVGSGVIVDKRGYILTNNHVAGLNAKSIVVSLYDGREVRGRALWADPTLDLSIIKIDGDNLSAAALGDSKAVRIGQGAIAIGNPLGLTFQRTVTAGIISALNRTIEVERGVFMEDLIQTDASINPGNSGGPLINIRGEVVGINTIKVTTAEAMGFAVPINVVKPIIAKVIKDGGFTTPQIGLQGLDRELAKDYNFTPTSGVYVYDCKDGECAHTAGIRKGDVILAVDDKPVNTVLDLKEALFSAGTGKTIKLRFRNGKGEQEVNIKLKGQK